MFRFNQVFCGVVLSIVLVGSVFSICAYADSEEAETGRFVRVYWYERDLEPLSGMSHTRRLRVNAPEVVLHPSFGDRSEVKENGLALIRIEEDLRKLESAELYIEIWGGHPGTANKRVTLNGRSTYYLPEVGTFLRNCTHSYPTIPLTITDLVNGFNAIQFACDSGTSFWGHFIVDNTCLRLELKENHTDLIQAGFEDFRASVTAKPAKDADEALTIQLACTEDFLNEIEKVDYYGFYRSYDENGNGKGRDWHGMTKDRQPYGNLGTSDRAPFSLQWDTSMIPADEHARVRAVVHFKEQPKLLYETAPSEEFAMPKPQNANVTLVSSGDVPSPFWTRAGRKPHCTIVLDDVEQIERVVFYVVVWDGGKGEVANPVTLNGVPVDLVGEGRHDVLYKTLEIDPNILKDGANEVVFFSDTHHHGIEVLLPGPALMVRRTK